MFAHFTQSGKCEWFHGGLVEFIRHYNKECGTSYILKKCLDVQRIGDATPKMPDVLLTDKTDGRLMVIERKLVVWPTDYIHRHENGHAFAEAIWQTAGGWYQDACYELIVSAPQMDKLNSRKVMKVAHDIASAIDPGRGLPLPMRGSVPVKWCFCRADVYEFERRKGIVVVYHDNTSIADFSDVTAKAGTVAAMQKELDAASAKFRDFRNLLRVVLLEFYGTDLGEEDIPVLTHMISMPPNIDEVWTSKREWVSEDDSEIGYTRLFKRKP